ncbi:FecR family protein [Pseudomonas sp. Pseusp122]|uniref:FecR family protein n=1 Tax=unclassified Pseudomonas TaxID=196821 RepID=UPI0039A51811
MSPTPAPEQPLSREDEALLRHREELRKRFPLPTPKPRKPRKAAAAAALLILLGAGLAWLDPAYRSETYSTAIGQHLSSQLADGSRLTLDSNTRVDVEWHVRSRRVVLHSGQALFDVSRTVLRPFEVQAGTTRIKVLGTLFGVRNLDDSVRVTLARGNVSVSSTLPDETPQQLIPGQQIEASHGHLLTPSTVDVEAVLAWKDNRLIFERTPLGDALAVIQRYRQAPIRLDDPSLTSLPISGTFDSSNVENLLGLLPSILPLSLASDADGTLHVRRKNTALKK